MAFIPTPLPTSVDTVADFATAKARTRDGGVVQTAGYSSVGDGGANQYIYRRTGRIGQTIDNGLFVAGSAGLDDYFEILDKSVVNVASFGANESGLDADQTTARIQTAIAAMDVGDYTTRVLQFTAGHTYQINSLQIDSASRIQINAGAANFFLNEEGVPGFTVSAMNVDWNGGTFFKNTGSPLVQALKFINSAKSSTMTASIVGVKARDIYRFMECYTNRALGVAYRLKIMNCETRNTNATYLADSGSFGIRLDGTVTGDSSGNDTDVVNCRLVGHYTNLYTNGAFTKLTGGSIDGAGDAGVVLDGAAHFSSVNTYFEYNKYHYRYTNSPYQPRSYGCSYTTSGTTAFSTGSALGSSSEHLSYGDNNNTQLDTHKPAKVYTNTATGLAIDVSGSAGTGLQVRHNATGTACRLEVTTNGVFEQFDKLYITTADGATNTFTATAHGAKVGESIRFLAGRTGALPGGLSNVATAYQIKTITTNTFTIEPLGGGTEVDLTDDGSGEWYMIRSFGKVVAIGSMSIGDKLNGVHAGLCHGFFRASTANAGNAILEVGRESTFVDATNSSAQFYSVTDASTIASINAAMKLKKDGTSGFSAVMTGSLSSDGVIIAGQCASTKPTAVHGLYRNQTANAGNLIGEIGSDTYSSLVFGRKTSMQLYCVDDAVLPIAIKSAVKFGRDGNTDVSVVCSGFTVNTGTHNYNVFTDLTNNELGSLEFVSNVYTLGTAKAGTGTARDIAIAHEGTTRILVNSTIAMTGPVSLSDILTLTSVGSTPADPADGKSVIWLDASGNLQIKATVGATTKTGTIISFASMT